MWQIELTLQVAWCTTKMRTSPPQTSAVRPPASVQPDRAKPARNGAASPMRTHSRNQRSTKRITGSSRRSRAKRRAEARSLRSKSQPVCACQMPLSTPRQPSPCPVCGLCGSPSSSAKVWCLRWSATQWITAPCRDIEPSTASVPRGGGRVEGAGRQQAGGPEGVPQARQAVHDGEDREVAAGDQAAPEKDDRGEEAQEGNDHRGDGDAAFDCAHVVNLGIIDDPFFALRSDKGAKSLASVTNKAQRPWELLPLDALAAWSPELPALSDEIIEAIRAEVPAYARPLEGAFGQAVRRGVGEALAQFDELVRKPGSERTAGGRSVYVALGRGEVREGRSLDALLAAYRVGARVAWRRLAAAGLAAGLPAETLVLLAESIFAYIDELSAESAEGFAQEQAERAGEAERRRAALIELLLSPTPPTPDALAAAADDARWPLPRELAVVAWSAEHGRRAAARLPLGSIWATVEGLVCAVVPDPAGPGRRAEVERALGQTAAGIGPTVEPSGAQRSYLRAAAALELARARGWEGLVAASDHRLELLCRADPGLVGEIAAARLHVLHDETDASR